MHVDDIPPDDAQLGNGFKFVFETSGKSGPVTRGWDSGKFVS
jgi:hypothetical protein